MRKTKPGISVILSVTYVIIVIAVLTVITLSVTTYLGKYFLSIRTSRQNSALSDCATSLIPYTDDENPDFIYSILSDYAISCNGRILFIDSSGCVQSDTFCLLNGTHPEASEISDILSGGKDFCVGYHRQRLTSNAVTMNNEYLSDASGSYWAAYYSIPITYAGSETGVLLLVAPVQDIVDQVNDVLLWLIIFDIVFILVAGAITFFLSSRITLSLRRFNRAISKMASGDFSVRVNEDGIGELGELAGAFNMMTERLENLDNARNQFVSDASHELKTPLASMKILSESLLGDETAPVELYREFMGDINSEVDRLSLVINDLLTLVKTDKGRETLIISSVELGTLIKHITGTVLPLAKKKRIMISFEYRDVTVQGDELRLQQVFTNLIDNAIKYSPENTTVTVTLTQTLSSAVVAVSDQGIGISKEALPHLFERFYRVDKARSRQAGGTGLGLSIVKQIVEQHGGSVEVKSEPGQGTTFTVTIPLTQKNVAQ